MIKTSHRKYALTGDPVSPKTFNAVLEAVCKNTKLDEKEGVHCTTSMENLFKIYMYALSVRLKSANKTKI